MSLIASSQFLASPVVGRALTSNGDTAVIGATHTVAWWYAKIYELFY